MKAVLNNDIIVHVTEQGDVEFKVPKRLRNIGFERLRVVNQREVMRPTGTLASDGSAVMAPQMFGDLVDLNDLNQIWVERSPDGAYTLHAEQIDGASLVTMTYVQRHILMFDAGKIRVKTSGEVAADALQSKKAKIKRRMRMALKQELGSTEQQMLALFAFITANMYYARTGSATLASWMDDMLPDLTDAFPYSRYNNKLETLASRLKVIMDAYHDALDNL